MPFKSILILFSFYFPQNYFTDQRKMNFHLALLCALVGFVFGKSLDNEEYTGNDLFPTDDFIPGDSIDGSVLAAETHKLAYDLNKLMKNFQPKPEKKQIPLAQEEEEEVDPEILPEYEESRDSLFDLIPPIYDFDGEKIIHPGQENHGERIHVIAPY